MPDYEARIKTKVGEFTVHFNDKSDLESKLAQIPEFASTIENSIGSILLKEPEKTLFEYSDICVMGPSGLVKLLKYPKKPRDIMRLALFLSPNPLNVAQLKEITGVDNPLANTGKDFTAKADGTYSLDEDGRRRVVEKIIPSLRGEKKTE